MSESEVKGAWFVSARMFLGADAPILDAVVAEVALVHRHVLQEPASSAWYPEAALQETLRAMRKVHCPEEGRFVDAIDACTVIGTSRFFRALLSLSTPAFVLRRVPTMWGQIRRGKGRVAVTTTDEDAVLQYRDFPYFADENYRLLTLGSLRAVVRTSTGQTPQVTLENVTRDAIDVRVRW